MVILRYVRDTVVFKSSLFFYLSRGWRGERGGGGEGMEGEGIIFHMNIPHLSAPLFTKF